MSSNDTPRTQAVEHDLFDAETYRDAQALNTRLGDAAHAYADRLLTAPELLRDTFLSLYQQQPTLAAADAMAATHRANRGMLAEMMDTREFANLRDAGTVNDRLGASFAATVVADRIIDALPEIDRERINTLRTLHDSAAALLDEAAAYDDIGTEYGDTALLQQAQERRDAAARAQAGADIAAAEIDATADQRADAVRVAFRAAATAAAEQLQQLADAIDAFGGAAPGSGDGTGQSFVSTAERLAIAKRLRQNPKLAELAQIVGRFVNIAQQVQRTKVDTTPNEIASVTRGNDLARVLPAELALLDDPATEDVFYHRFAEKQLQQYKLDALDKTGRGPLIVATDESSSMLETLDDGNSRELWSKAVALALLAVARRQRRDFAWIHFANAHNLKVHTFVGGVATPLQAIDAADQFFGGGTDYNGWIGKSLELVNGSRFERADVVLLTDGCANVSPPLAQAWAQARAARGMRCYSVMIGNDAPAAPNGHSPLAEIVAAHYTSDAARVLDSISDTVIDLADMADERGALSTVFAV